MKTLRFILFIVTTNILHQCTGYTQNNDDRLAKTSEKIVKYSLNDQFKNNYDYKMPVGNINSEIIYLFKTNDEQFHFYVLDENNYKFNQLFNDLDLKGKLYHFSVNDSCIFYTQIYFTSMNDLGYNTLKLLFGKRSYILDSIHNADKKIHSSFSLDGKKLVVNTLNTLLDYYNPEQDDRFAIYSLENIKDGKFTKEYIPCEHCSDGHIIGEDLFFAKSNQRDDFSGGFLWKDIYKAPLNDLNDTVKIAAFSNILAITPDGKYILATRHFDLPNKPCAIIDVENKKYQLLLGREYSKADAFYSYKEKKFAFDFEERIVYVDFPKEYPFDALQKGNPNIPKWSNKEFYQQFMHKPFE